MAIQKRKSKHEDLTDGSGNLTKKSETEKAQEILEKAKLLKRPVRFASSSDSEFGRSLKTFEKKEPKERKVKEAKPMYTIERVMKFKYYILGKAHESGKPPEECCKLVGISINNFKSYYDRYLDAKEIYNL